MKRRTLIQSMLVFLLMGFGLRPKESQAAVRYPKTPGMEKVLIIQFRGEMMKILIWCKLMVNPE